MLDFKKRLLNSDLFSWKLPELMPCGCSIATDFTCLEIIHNPVAAGFYGIEPWSNYSFSSSPPPQIKVYQDDKLVMPREMPIQRSAWYGDENNGLELKFVWPDGSSKTSIWSTRPLRDENGVIIGAFGIFEDVTELVTMNYGLNKKQMNFLQEMVDEWIKKLKLEFEKRILIEREVARNERINVIHQLAAGLAHEIRNPMTTIRGFIQLLQNKTELLKYKSEFELIVDELDRANSIIVDFLSVANRKQSNLRNQNLNELLINLFPLLQADALNQGKSVVLDLGEIANLEIDSNEIIQLVLNLTRNGLEAMAQDGCLRIKTFVEKQNIVLSFTDEGTGIITEHISKLGTLFFTTKENGSGLGMPMCYDIADRHRAQIVVETGSTGTTVEVLFGVA